MRKRFKIILNVEVIDPEQPFPAGGSYTHKGRIEGIATLLTNATGGWFDPVEVRISLDKIIDKGEIKIEREGIMHEDLLRKPVTKLGAAANVAYSVSASDPSDLKVSIVSHDLERSTLTPREALNLLTWLEQERKTLRALAAKDEEEKESH